MSTQRINSRIRFIIAGLALVAIILGLASPAKAITWGEVDGDNTYSNVGVIVADVEGIGTILVCSGTLIAPNVFLTAGHCSSAMASDIASGILSLEDLSVSFSPEEPKNPDTWHPVAAIHTHPQFGTTDDQRETYDMGVLELAEDVELPVALLPEIGFLDDLRSEGVLREGPERSLFLAVGYGATLSWPQHPALTINEVRRYTYTGFQALTDHNITLWSNNNFDYGGTCYGDSGGPIFFDYDGELWLVAISRAGSAGCIAMSFDYRMDTPVAVDFLADYLP